jgi:hypothetical protein
MNLSDKLAELMSKPSDINEHLPLLVEFARRCDHVTEMGVRDVVSTYAFLAGLSLDKPNPPKKLVSYDVYESKNIGTALEAAKENDVVMKFIKADVLKVEIEETDLLFIDTLHIYSQLKQELAMHAHKAKKYIILHDVVTYGHKPEPATFQTHSGHVHQIPEVLKNYVKNDKGIMPAIEEFLKAEPQWKIELMRTNNNGLMILKRG